VSRIRAVAWAAVVIAGCSYYDASLLGGVPSDAALDGNAGSGQCASERPPAAPAVADAGGDLELVLALRTLDFHESSAPKSIGFDLDKTCTCQGEQSSCVLPAGSSDYDPCDGPGGRDNNGAQLIASSAMLGLTSSSINNDIEKGDSSMLIRIRGYNGLPDDDQVSVAWLVPLGLGKVPLWDGTDTWNISGTSLKYLSGQPNLEDPLAVDNLAYVTGGRLVASLKGGAKLGIAANFTIVINNAFLVIQLVQNDVGWGMADGVLAGIWRSIDVLTNLRGLTVTGQKLCTNHPLYPNIKQGVCRATDICVDSIAPTAKCDSISLAFTFTGTGARLGTAVDVPALTSPCEPQYDPANDPCD
jgi:hypothetical protein